MASLINDPKIKNPPDWYLTTGLRGDLVSMIAKCDPQVALEFLQQTKFIITQDSLQSDRVQGVLSFEARMEQRLALQVARNDPKRALEMAEESLVKLMSGHFCFLEKRHSSPRERRLTLAQCFSAG